MRKNRILLINTNQIKPPVAPLGLMHLIGPLKANGYIVDVADLCFANGSPDKIIGEKIKEFEPDYVGATLRNIDNGTYSDSVSYLPGIKMIFDSIRSSSDVPIISGGAGFSMHPAPIFEYIGADYGIFGRGEQALLTMLSCLREGKSVKDIPGAVFREDDRILVNEPEKIDFGSVALPDRTYFDNARYLSESRMGNIQTKAGCAWDCSFCINPQVEGRTNMRPPKRVADELEQMIEIGITRAHVNDSVFNFPIKHAANVCDEIITRGIGDKINFPSYCSPEPFTRELAQKMRKAGFDYITFGIDSCYPKIMRWYNKFFDEDQVIAVGKYCREAGIKTMFNLLLGGEGENRETIKYSFDIMRRANPDVIGVMYGVRIYPNSPLAYQMREKGELNKDNPNLHGIVEGNEHLLFPLYFVSSELGPEIGHIARELAEGDKRFLIAGLDNYPYANNNQNLAEICRNAEIEGAFWEIPLIE